MLYFAGGARPPCLESWGGQLPPLPPLEGAFEKEERNSPIPSYVNVELDDGTVPMTTSPGYMPVERMTEGPKPLYGNL